ncbi:MAG: hypothetical protein O2875_04305 [Planctomycetota bacterium]|nr:hypothetical protein [Planctomycetota bacterium]MDA1261760.1 hypothetical protein [Planctomycetota bacterium]
MLLIPLPKFDMIRDKAKFASHLQDSMEVQQRFVLNNATLVVARLWPRIAEVQVNDGGDFVGQPKTTELGCVCMQNANIVEFSPAHTICRISPEFRRPFDAEKIRVGLANRLLDEKCSFACTDFHLEGIFW